MSDSQLPSDSLFSDLRVHADWQLANCGICRVKPDVLLALIECAEALQYAIDYEAGDVGCIRHWRYVARDSIDKLEAL